MTRLDIFRIVREQAKKITGSGAKAEQSKKTLQVVEGHAVEQDPFNMQYQDLQQLFRTQFPSVTRQLLGKRYNTVNNISKIILPNGMEQAADELLELLADFASQLASTESVLSAMGSREITQLSADTERSHRASIAFKDVNKFLAALQGAVSGSTGVVGAVLDLPASVIFSMKTIYEIGHSYGFELDDEEDLHVVYFALSKIDVGLIAEKQALFLALRSIKNMFATGDMAQITSFLNSNYSVDQFKNYLVDDTGHYKWSGFNTLNKLKVIRFALPLVGGAVGALYNVKLIEDIAEQADDIFAKARIYLNANPNLEVSILEAYHHQVGVLTQQSAVSLVAPVLETHQQTENVENSEITSKVEPELISIEPVVKPPVQDDVETIIEENSKEIVEENVLEEQQQSEVQQADKVITATETKAPVKRARTPRAKVVKKPSP